MFEIGRICMKTAGREAGKFCVIVDVLEEGFVLVTGPKAVTRVKRRKCNIDHLEPTPEVIKIGKNASDDEVLGIFRKQGIIEKIGGKLPSEREIDIAKDAERKRMAARKREEASAAVPEKKPEEVVRKEAPPAEPEEEKKAAAETKAKKPAAKKKAEKPKKEEAVHKVHHEHAARKPEKKAAGKAPAAKAKAARPKAAKKAKKKAK